MASGFVQMQAPGVSQALLVRSLATTGNPSRRVATRSKIAWGRAD
jgi:hypothetical protein